MPLPTPSPPPLLHGPSVPNGTWYTLHADWEMNSPTAHRTIRAIRNTSFYRLPAGGTRFDVQKGWSFVLLPPVPCGKHNSTWAVQCPCTRHN